MRVGILGYGRFGRALAGLAREAGARCLALDPVVPVPRDEEAGSLEGLVEDSEFIVLALPIPALPGALRRVAPLLRPSQVLFDVGSVKVMPCRWMAEILGPSRPYAGTHPLFGPVSLARAERPLRVVLCPAAEHPQAAGRVGAFFERLGCEVLVQSAEDHDRVMATTHALTFFLAKGLLEVGAGAELPFTPPSFHAIQHTLESVREDAGHLFVTVQNQNPFAAGARAGLLEALQAIERDLREAAERPDEESPGLAIPELSARSPRLQEVREVIDGLDRDILDLLARRMELARRAALAKAELGAPVLDPSREASLLEKRRAWAAEAGLDPAGSEEVFRSILRLSRKTQGR
ncbi:MAG: prephenate dehydrogenase/arogenate dehydrogenase family protein [Acidobacteria bacterium]|nr:prephenate dehydrogenase/arogenate dehydrogenase family protein [Acidobacteriota bacterium]